METERSAQSATPIMPAPDATVQSSRVNWAIPWRRLFSMETPEGWKRDFQRLAWPFFLWKALLLTLAALCPGPGYDTSALIFIDPSLKRHKTFSNSSWGDRLILNLFRWDALYFIKAAVRGKVHEQEWAFSWAYSWLLSYVGQSPPFYNGSKSVLQQRIMATIDISTACHLGSVWMLFRLLTVTVESPRKHQIARLGAILHIMTPASLFLSSPYAEAPFSLLNITGMLLYAQSRTLARDQQHSVLGDAYKLGSGLLFGAATLMRGNGLLSGLILLYDLASYLPQVFSMRLTVHDVRRMIVTCVAGGIIALCFVWPQYLAYVEYCSGEDVSDGPPWCQRTIPSIYSWVQSHYWNVGLFRYWALPNIPLFVMAAPMLWVMITSSLTVLRGHLQPLLHGRPVPQNSATAEPADNSAVTHNFPELALPQLVLAIAAITSFHVQIVNRLASGYPTWYMIIATWLVDGQTMPDTGIKLRRRSQWVVRGMVTYALAQGMLFANFLPPA